MRDRGFSLMEMLIALAVLLIALSSMFGVFSQGAKYLAQIKAALPAYMVARNTVEKYFSWAQLDGLDNVVDNAVTNGEYSHATDPARFPLVNMTLFTPSAANASYTSGINITNVTNPAGTTMYPNRLKRMKVSVAWFDGNNRVFNLTTLKADY
jgi:prepilin-type N-terminal cleavage/methylation domain-containing protein